MPHIIVKLWPGRNDELKNKLAGKIAETVAEELKVDIGDISVAFEEVSQSDWGEHNLFPFPPIVFCPAAQYNKR